MAKLSNLAFSSLNRISPYSSNLRATGGALMVNVHEAVLWHSGANPPIFRARGGGVDGNRPGAPPRAFSPSPADLDRRRDRLSSLIGRVNRDRGRALSTADRTGTD